MSRLLRKCESCGSYTLDLKCHKCGSSDTINPHPPKFSLDDKYLRYRVRERYEKAETKAE